MSSKITLKSIINDKVSGSSEILEKLNKYLLQNTDDKAKLRNDLLSIKKALKSFEAINSYIKQVEKLIGNGDTRKLRSFLDRFNRTKTESYNRIFNNAKRYLTKFNTILTLSNSKTLLEVFKIWSSKNKRLKIL